MNRNWKKRNGRGKWVALFTLGVSLMVMAAMAGLVASTPTTTAPINVISGVPVDLGYVFGNFEPPPFCGKKYLDYNGNGKHDPGEPGLPDVLVELSGIDGMGRPVSLFTVTGPDGSFFFPDLWPGTYTVTEYPGAPPPHATAPTPWRPCTAPEPPIAPPTETPPCNNTCTQVDPPVTPVENWPETEVPMPVGPF